jgi:Flp pilus assembly protein TadG
MSHVEAPAHPGRARCPHPHRGEPAGEEGYVTLYVVIITVAIMAMAGLLIDGGKAIAAREKAADVAQQAARAASDQLSPNGLRAGQPADLAPDPARAAAAAQRVLVLSGVTGRVTFHGDTAVVTATVNVKTSILSAIGITELSGTAHAASTAIHGTTTTNGGH